MQVQVHHEVLEGPRIIEKPLVFIGSQLLPLARKLDDETDLVRPVPVKPLAGVCDAR